MRKASIVAGLFLAAGIAANALADDVQRTDPAPDSPLSFYAATGVYSDYVFRGMRLYDDMSIQPNLGVSYDLGDAGRINANIWMHIPGGEKNVKVIDQFSEQVSGLSNLNSDEIFSPSRKFFELDPTISYDITMDIVTLTFGHTWYTDPEEGEVQVIRPVVGPDGTPVPASFNVLYSRGDTSEFFAGVSLDTILHPEVTIVKDYREFEYWYYTLGFSQPIPATRDEMLTFIPYATFAWATNTPDNDAGNFSTNYSRDGLEHINVGLAAQIVMENWVIKPGFTYVFVIDKNGGPDDITWGGFDISYNM